MIYLLLAFFPLLAWGNNDFTYVSCVGLDSNRQEVSTWAKDRTGSLLRLKGKWGQDQKGSVFTTGEYLEAELFDYCVESLGKAFGPGTPFSNLSAKNLILSPGAEIVFSWNPGLKTRLFTQISQIDSELEKKFLEFAAGVMTSSFYNQLLASSLRSYVQEFPDYRIGFKSYVENAIQYSQEQIAWTSESLEDRVVEFISLFRFKSDFEILSYQFKFQNGLERGQFNSFVDLATDAFKPIDPVAHAKFPGLFDEKNPDHLFTLAWIKAFSSFANLISIFQQIKNLVPPPRGSLNAVAQERLLFFYNRYVIEADRCVQDLARIGRFLSKWPVSDSTSGEASFSQELLELKRKLWSHRPLPAF